MAAAEAVSSCTSWPAARYWGPTKLGVLVVVLRLRSKVARMLPVAEVQSELSVSAPDTVLAVALSVVAALACTARSAPAVWVPSARPVTSE